MGSPGKLLQRVIREDLHKGVCAFLSIPILKKKIRHSLHPHGANNPYFHLSTNDYVNSSTIYDIVQRDWDHASILYNIKTTHYINAIMITGLHKQKLSGMFETLVYAASLDGEV